MPRILHISSNETLIDLVKNSLDTETNLEYINIQTKDNLASYLKSKDITCILCDFEENVNPINIYQDLEESIPVVVFTKNSSAEKAFKCCNAGIAEYIDIKEHTEPGSVLKETILQTISDKSDRLKKYGSDYYFNQITNLQEVITELFETNDLEEGLSIVRDGFIDSFGYKMVGIWIKETQQEKDVLVPKVSSEISDELIGGEHPVYEKGNSISWEAYEENEIRIINDLGSEDNLNNESTDIQSETIIPMDNLGVINIASLKNNAFSEDESKLMRLWAKSVTTAIDRIKKRNELEENQEELQKEKERMDQFVSFVTHDIVTPLQIAEGQLDIVQSDGEYNERLDTVYSALERMEQMIDDIKTITKQRKSELNLENTDIGELIEKCWVNTQTKECTVENNVDLQVEADRSKVANLIENLFKNSIDHGGSEISIIADTLESGNGFYIQDTGSGIDRKVIDRLFESGVTTSSTGSGLGLKIASEVVDLHNWEIEAVNTDLGARFNIYV